MTPLLLLHPLGGDGSFWSSCARLLGRAVLTPDLPGHGRAPAPDRPALEEYAAAVASRLDGPVVAVGVSLGGLVAQELALGHPELVTGVVLVDTVAVYPSPFRDTWPQRAATARSAGMAALADAMESMWFTPGFRARHPETVRAARRVFLDTDPEGYARSCEMLHVADVSRRLRDITVPVLVVCGDQDAPVFVAAARELAAAVPDAELRWLEDAQHAAVLEQPETFARLLRQFLASRGL